MITIVNYGLGNLGSISNMLNRIGKTSELATSIEQIMKAEKLILPGVGSFDLAMKNLNESGLLNTLNDKVLNQRTPVLGICLGMQLLTKGSEEGKLPGLGWIDAYTYKFTNNNTLKVPHMGWNEVHVSKPHALINSLSVPSRYYFVHSYYVKYNDREDELMSCNYGIDFTCAIQHENIMGVQFHPEKSHKFGMELLRNFSEL